VKKITRTYPQEFSYQLFMTERHQKPKPDVFYLG